MAPKKDNGKGKKFSDRLPTEPRPRAVKKTNTGRPDTRSPRSFDKSESPRSRPPFKPGDRNDRGPSDRPRYGDKPTGRFNNPSTDNPRGRKPAGDGPYRKPREEGGDRPHNRRPSGDAPFRKPREEGGVRPYSRRPSGDSPSYGRKPREEGADRPFTRRPAGDGPSRRPSGDSPFNRNRKPGEDSPRGRRPAGGAPYNRGPREEGSDRPFTRRPSGDGPTRRPAGDKPFNSRSRKPDEGSPERSYGPRNYYKKDGNEDRSPRSRNTPGNGQDRGTGSKPWENRRTPEDGVAPRKKGPAPNPMKTGPEADARRMDKKMVKNTRRTASANFKGSKRNWDKAGDNLASAQSLVEKEVRLNRYIANSGMCSRREADALITQGLVHINGAVVTELGMKVNPGDDVKVDGRRITPEKPVYIILNKPKGYITSTIDPEGRPTVMDLLDLPGKERIYPIGRLDRNTTGVLLLTNDGELAQKLMHPSFQIKKVYRAKLDQKPTKDHMLAWVNGIELEDGFMTFEQIGFVDDTDQTIMGVEVHSGRNRIVRRMFEHFGYDVNSLDRVLLGDFDHLKLGRGKWRFLNEKEVEYVGRLKRMKPKKD